MQIKNLYFVQPCIVECVSDENLHERKLVFFDFNKRSIVNPFVDGKKLDIITSYDELLEVSIRINKVIYEQEKNKEESGNQELIFEKQTNLNNIIKTLNESSLNEFREVKL